MDVDEVDEHDADCWDDGLFQGQEIAAVWPTTQCYNCKGYGHMARNCPNKGGGKGGKGGKGFGKDGKMDKASVRRTAKDLESQTRAMLEKRLEKAKASDIRGHASDAARWGTSKRSATSKWPGMSKNRGQRTRSLRRRWFGRWLELTKSRKVFLPQSRLD